MVYGLIHSEAFQDITRPGRPHVGMSRGRKPEHPKKTLEPGYRVFVRYRRSENSPAKFCLFPERALPFHNNPPVTLQYSPATPILNEHPEAKIDGLKLSPRTKIVDRLMTTDATLKKSTHASIFRTSSLLVFNHYVLSILFRKSVIQQVQNILVFSSIHT